MLNKGGATQWTIGKLMTIVLLVIVLALVVYGVSTKGLNPLIERAGGMFDEVQILFGFGDDGSVEGDCGNPYLADIGTVGKGMITICKGSCSMKFEENLAFGNEFNWTQDSFFIKSDSHPEGVLDIIDNLSLVIKERDVNRVLRDDYKTYIGELEDDSFMGSGIVSINFLVKKNNFGWKFSNYFKWENGVWFEEKDNKWEMRDWNDFEGLKKINSKSGDVFYRIGTPEDLIKPYSTEEGDYVFLEDIRAEENFYEPFKIFRKNSGKIDNEGDFQLFQDWFFSEKWRIIKLQNFLDSRLKESEELLPTDSLKNIGGEKYNLFLGRASDGEGVFYFKTLSEIYGLKGESLRLVKGDGEGRWKSIDDYQILSWSDNEFEEKSKIHKIRKFLESKC